MTIINLKPKETRLFENEQQVRLKPVANSNAGVLLDSAPGADCEFILTPNSEELRETNVNLVDNVGSYANALPAVAGPTGTQGLYLGAVMADGTYALQGGSIPNVPTKMALLFRQLTASEHTVTIDGLDVASVAVAQESFSVETDGVGPHILPEIYSEITDVSGSGLVGGGASDEIYIGPAIDTGLDAHVGQSGRNVFGPRGDPNDSLNDGDSTYATCEDTVDRDCFCGLPLPPGIISMDSLQLQSWSKQIGAGSGIQLRIRFSTNPSVSYFLAVNTATGTEGGTPAPTSFTFPTIDGGPQNPATGVRMTPSEFATMEVGVRFLADSGPTIEKRWQFIRITVGARITPLIPGTDRLDAGIGHDHWKAVAQDPFGTPDDNQYAESAPSSFIDMRFDMENLPAEALSVNSVRAAIRQTQMAFGHKNGAGANDWPCGLATPPRSNLTEFSRLDGPLEQVNSGGFLVRIADFPTSVDSARFTVGIGDPPAGCGTFQDYSGDDVGWGNFVDKELLRTLNSSSGPITLANVDAMEIGVRMLDATHQYPYRTSRVYAEVEYLRRPNGASSIFHFAVDDDPDAPDDSDFMESQHTNNKKFAVDFPSIPEVSSIASVKVRMRAKTSVTATVGWRLIMRLGDDAGTDQVQASQTNTSFDTIDFDFNTSPFSGGSLPWTRAEVNNLVVIWEALGENAFEPKQISTIGVTIDAELIPEKIDAARDIASRKLRLFRRPRPLLTIRLPIWFLDAGILGDVSVIHNALPRTEAMLGFERWDRSLMRVFKEVIDMNRDLVTLTLLDLREYLNTLWITGRTTSKGQSAEGMAILTPGVTLSFTRRTNDYFEDPFAGLIQELAADEPPQGIEGILIQGRTINRVINSAFADGSANTYTSWAKTIEGSGGSIVDDLTDLAFDQNSPNPPLRSVLFTASDDPPTDEVYLLGLEPIEHGVDLSPEGGRYAITIEHKDDDGEPMSVALSIDPPIFTERPYNFRDDTWETVLPLIWQTLPVRSVRTRDTLIGNLRNMEDIPGLAGANPEEDLRLHIGVRTTANQKNHLYTAQVEGGTTEALDDRNYPSSFGLTRTGPVIRDGLQFFVPNFRTRPSYPAELRGTAYLQMIPQWDSATLPSHVGAKRYIWSLEVDASNSDKLWYDSDTEKFIFERKIAGTAKTVEFYYPQVTKDVPLAITIRWISNIGDLGEAPFSFTIFIEGEQGTTDAHGQKFPLPSESKLWLGSNNGAELDMLDGTIRNLNIVQFALPQARIRRLP